MLDDEYLLQFEQCTLPKENFKHRGHLRICWWYLTHYPYEQAVDLIHTGIIRYAGSLGALHIYDKELTQQWISRVYKLILEDKIKAKDFAAFIVKHDDLFNKNKNP